MKAYSGYNQIRMYPDDEEKTSFIIDQGVYCYKAMPFRLKNECATYQRYINFMFRPLIGRSMEVYVDDLLVKRIQESNHFQYLS